METQTEIKLAGEPLSRRSVEKMIDTMSVDEIVTLMTKNQNVDWTPVLALMAYNDSVGLYPIKDNKNWFKNCQEGNRRLDYIKYNVPHIIHKIKEKGFLTSCISKEWRSKKPGHEMYGIEYITSNGTETQYYMQDSEDLVFKSLEDAENFLDLYHKILDIMINGKKITPYKKEIVIVVIKVAKRIEFER